MSTKDFLILYLFLTDNTIIDSLTPLRPIEGKLLDAIVSSEIFHYICAKVAIWALEYEVQVTRFA